MRTNWQGLVEGDYSPLEGARLFARLLEKKVSASTIAQKFGRAIRTITDKVRIARSKKLSAEVKSMWDLQMITFHEICAILAKAEKGLSTREQIKLARQAENAREAKRGNERRPRLLRTKTAVVRDRRKRAVGHGAAQSEKEAFPSSLPVVAQDPTAGEDIGQYYVLGTINPMDIMKLMEVATKIHPETVPWLFPLNGHRLRVPEMWLLWLLRHWHHGIRERAFGLLPPPRPLEERVALLQAIREEEKMHFTVISPKLIALVSRIMAQNTSERTKERLIADLTRGSFDHLVEGEKDNHHEERPPEKKGQRSGGQNRGHYYLH